LVSGRRRGLAAGLLRGLLRGLEVPYALAVRGRNRAFERRLLAVHRVEVPVISVGNLTLGGTGKTPLVAWLARWLADRGRRVAVVSRGYKARPGSLNDEALELAAQLPEVVLLQDPDRVRAAREAIGQHACEVILLDDAFQHRRLHRDLDIVLLDALEPFGWEHVFPRGSLREPPAGLRRAHVVALSRADVVGAEIRDGIRRRVAGLAPAAAWIELVHQPQYLVSASGRRCELDALSGQPVAAFCGIGNPAGFRHTLAALGWNVIAFRAFADHHAYPPADVADLQRWAAELGVAAMVCTRKDLMKFRLDRLGDRELWALAIGLEIPVGKELLERQLDLRLDSCPDRQGPAPAGPPARTGRTLRGG
jgi:tetraacyldisaccharide 4'-kinase